jgi:hypothetical protein
MITGMVGMISEVVGMPAIGFGDEGPRQQTAEEALLRNRSQQTVNSTIYENLASSIERLGYVSAELVLATYDTERDITVIEQDGKAARVRTNVAEAGIDLNQMRVSVKAGPLMSTQRKDNMRSYIALGQMLGPQYTAVIGPKIAESIDNADQELIDGIRMIAQASMGGGQDPNAQAEGDQLRQALAEAQQTILQLQMSSRDQEIKILADQALTEQKHQNAIELKVIDQQGAAGLEQEKAVLKAESDEAADYRKVQMAIAEQQATLDREYSSL